MRWVVRHPPALREVCEKSWPADENGQRWINTDGPVGKGRDPLRLIEDDRLTDPGQWFLELDTAP